MCVYCHAGADLNSINRVLVDAQYSCSFFFQADSAVCLDTLSGS